MVNPLFLHLSDLHISDTDLGVEDIKRDLGIRDHRVTKSEVLECTLVALAAKLSSEGRQLSGVLISGDCRHGKEEDKSDKIKGLLLEHLASVGLTANKIVVTPGNHDVKKGSPPGSDERYSDFISTWRGADECITPLLDGIDFDTESGKPKKDLMSGFKSHCLIDKDHNWVIIPVNSSNWSQIKTEVPKALEDIWEEIPSLATGDKRDEIKKALGKLLDVDAALVSNKQFKVLAELVQLVSTELHSDALKIVVMHHHLLPVSEKEEHKAFSDIINLGRVRQLFHDWKIKVVFHGHKHSSACFFDHIYPSGKSHASKVLVVAGGAFSSKDTEFCQLVEISSLPRAPHCMVQTVSSVLPGSQLTEYYLEEGFQLWENPPIAESPLVVSGDNVDDVYDRVCSLIKMYGDGKQIICHLKLPPDSGIETVIPQNYPFVGDRDKLNTWFKSTVEWWQTEDSKLVKRIPYIHGVKLVNFGGIRDQVHRVAALLKGKSTTKALAILIDPVRDFNHNGTDEKIPSFCLAQFSKTDGSNGNKATINCIAYYRAQEFRQWWPINLGEIVHLQRSVAKKIGANIGWITTICGDSRIPAQDRMPAHVAVPTVDQLYDKNPQCLIAMCQAIIARKRTDRGTKYLNQFSDCLKELVIEEPHPDGVPVAIEGIEFLLNCFAVTKEVSKEKQPDVTQIIAALKAIHSANVGYQKNSVGATEIGFEEWSHSVKTHVKTIQGLIEKL